MNPFRGFKKNPNKHHSRAIGEFHWRKCDKLDNAEDTKLIILLNSTIVQQQREADKS